jgi:hypothetical protein
MPTNRTRRSRLWQDRLDDYKRWQLIEGPDAVGRCYGIERTGYLIAPSWAEMSEVERVNARLKMKADWQVHHAELMVWWRLGKDAPRFSPKPWIFPRHGSLHELPWAAEEFGLPDERETADAD